MSAYSQSRIEEKNAKSIEQCIATGYLAKTGVADLDFFMHLKQGII